MKLEISICIFLSITLNSCKLQPLETVNEVNLDKYSGLWYEYAAFPTTFEKGCRCTTAEYTKNENGIIEAVNKCQKPGKFSEIKGKAFVVENSNNTKLKVQFFWPFKADYWIIDLDKNYEWAVVGNESRKYLWILTRRTFLNQTTYQEIIERLEKKGFNVSKLQKTDQDCK